MRMIDRYAGADSEFCRPRSVAPHPSRKSKDAARVGARVYIKLKGF